MPPKPETMPDGFYCRYQCKFFRAAAGCYLSAIIGIYGFIKENLVTVFAGGDRRFFFV